MNTILVELPAELRSEFEELGLTDESRIVAWVADAVRQKLAAVKQMEYLTSQAKRADAGTFKELLTRIPAVEPAEEDRW